MEPEVAKEAEKTAVYGEVLAGMPSVWKAGKTPNTGSYISQKDEPRGVMLLVEDGLYDNFKTDLAALLACPQEAINFALTTWKGSPRNSLHPLTSQLGCKAIMSMVREKKLTSVTIIIPDPTEPPVCIHRCSSYEDPI